jgi:exosortase/archaeosortase family protein
VKNRGAGIGARAGVGALVAWIAVIVVARAGVAAPDGLLAPLTSLVAAVVQQLLAWGGIATLRHDALLYQPGGFAYEVVAGCTGILPAAVLTIAVLASPAHRSAKRRGLAVTIPVILAVNLLRLVHLFYLGVYAPRQFPLAHVYLWEAALVLVTLVLWQGWWYVSLRFAESRSAR